MKRKSLRSALFVLLVLTSLCSYIFLNTVEMVSPGVDGSLSKELQQLEPDEQDMALPDVQIMKTILQKSKELLPAS
ncbi:MAG: hypothetical protein AAFP19_19060 [Bacteroidota bacterium]